MRDLNKVAQSAREAVAGTLGPGLLTLILSGIINGLLMFVFCCVFAVLIFQDKREDSTVLKDFLPIGVSMHIFSVMMGCLFYACFSSCKASIAGPDINPALFFAIIVESIQIGADPDNPTAVEAILPTSLVAICIGTVAIGLTFLTLGHFKLTRIVQYLPASLLNGFLACIGYKVMKAALTTTCGDIYYKKPYKFIFWKLMLPALPVGFGLYLAKAYHIGQPGVTISVLLLVPLALFYMSLVVSGTSLEQARDQCLDIESSGSCAGGWFYPEFGRGEFGGVYDEFDIAKVDAGALLYSFGDLPAMLLIVVIDYLLKLAGTKKALGFDFPFDNEMKTAGIACLASAMGGVSVPAYSQTKFTVLNIGITHNPSSRVPGIVTGLFNAVLYFWGFPLINYLPRFFLGGLLIYAGLGFVVDNLIKSWNRVSREEFMAIWAIVIVNAATSLLVAVVVGIVLSAIIFALTYGRIGVVKAYFQGRDYESKVVRSVKDASKLTHLSKRYAIVQMQNYIFFGSAGQILDFTKALLKEQLQIHRMGRIMYLIFDWTHVYGIDYSGLGVFGDIINILRDQNVMIVYTGVKERFIRSMLREGILQHVTAVFDHLDLGVEWIEEQLLEWAHLVRSRWLEFRPVIKLHDLAKNQAKHDALEEVLKDTGFGHELWRYVKRIKLAKGDVLCEPGKPAESLYIVQQGKFSSVFADSHGNVRKIRSYARGAYINEMAVFATALQQHKIIADSENCAVIVMSKYEISRLRASRQDIFMALQQTILRHYWQSNLKMEREISDLEQFVPLPGKSSNEESSSEKAPSGIRSATRRKSSSIIRRGSLLITQLMLKGSSAGREIDEDTEAIFRDFCEAPSAAAMMASFRGSQKRALSALGDKSLSKTRVEDAGLAFLHAIINLASKDADRWLLQEELLGAGPSNRNTTGAALDALFEGLSTGLELRHGGPDIVPLYHYEIAKAPSSAPSRIAEEAEEAETGLDHRNDSSEKGGETAEADEANNLKKRYSRKWRASVCKLSQKLEAECRAVYKSYADQDEEKVVLSTQVIQMLQDTGHYLSQKEAALLIHSKIWINKSGSGSAHGSAKHSDMALGTILKGVAKNGLSRHIDTASISRSRQLEFMTLFLSHTAVFSDLDISFPGIITKVAERSELLVFHQGECVCVESTPVNSMLVVVDGMINVRRGGSKRTLHASQSPVIFGEDLVFLPQSEVGIFSSTVEVASQQIVLVEVFRHVLQRLVPQDHPKSRQLQDRAVRIKIDQESRFQLPSVRKLESVIRQQQMAPFGARYRALALIDLFKESVQADQYLISRVAAEAELVIFKQDEYVFHQGDVGDYLLVVVAGDVNVRIKLENGVTHTHKLAFDESKGGYVLGELAFYSRRHERTADVIVQSESLVALKISRFSLQSIFEASHNIWFLIRERAQEFRRRKENNASVGVGGKLKSLGAQTYRLLVSTSTMDAVEGQQGSEATDADSSSEMLTGESNSNILRAMSEDSRAAKVAKRAAGIWDADMQISESDFINIVTRLTFFPLRKAHLEVIRTVFQKYSTAPMHRHRHVHGHNTGAQAFVEDRYPEGCITLSNLSALVEDASLVLPEKALANTMDEWQITDATGYLEPAISFTSFLSIIAAAVKRQCLLLEVETIFKLIVATDPALGPKLTKSLQSIESRAMPIDEKWGRLSSKGFGINAKMLQHAWLEYLDVDLSLEAAEEMIFEADESENGFISFSDWLDSIHSVYQIEVEGADNFTIFESKLMNIEDKNGPYSLNGIENSSSFLGGIRSNSLRKTSENIRAAAAESPSAAMNMTRRIASMGPNYLAGSFKFSSFAARKNSAPHRRVAPDPSGAGSAQKNAFIFPAPVQ